MSPQTIKSAASAIAVILVEEASFGAWSKRQPPHAAQWMAAASFTAKPGTHLLLPDEEGRLSKVIVGAEKGLGPWSLAALPDILPEGHYRLETAVKPETADALYLGWLLGSYRFTRYKKAPRPLPVLEPIKGCHGKFVTAMAEALNEARDLINTPANDMGPEELAAACRRAAKDHSAQYSEIVGEDLLKKNYPAIYEVGKASVRAPRLIDIRWGNEKHPRLTLVGKGVCFDSGGLDIKPSSGMRLMKKDMAGAASMLALARIIMSAGLKVRLRLLIPAVENSIAGNAYRPMDVIKTRKGLNVEIGNTDAEGRIILCDALAEADSEKPDLIIDSSTLTGAARTAVGTELSALFSNSDEAANGLLRHGLSVDDPLWRLPLWEGYREMLKSATADINSAPEGGYAGAITAALYLKEFVSAQTPWMHIDMMGWNLRTRPGRPVGAEPMAVRALFAFLKTRYAAKK